VQQYVSAHKDLQELLHTRGDKFLPRLPVFTAILAQEAANKWTVDVVVREAMTDFTTRSMRLQGRTSGLSKPISEDPHYIVRVFYGGDYCEESLEGPFATLDEAAHVHREQWDKGHGAIVYRCVNATREVL
jgi:hypothetical protein